ncbi:MAG: hypothetical protein PHE25_04260 [Candidatus Gracilibacteria bacterium]|nr:hypothetical protein [Candidatus Gracilibacteria bacterium]
MFQNEKIVEIKTCRHCNSSFEITDKDLEFYEKISPSFGGKKYNISSPTLCPDCRFQNRQSFLNCRNLYKRTCDYSGKEIISNYSPDKPYKVYDPKIWFSDKFDSIVYGKDFEFNKSFFNQYNELFQIVPRMALDQGINMNNSFFNNYADFLKDCYMCIHAVNDVNCYYSYSIFESNDCMDCYGSYENKNCYECIFCKQSYDLFYCNLCNNCSDSYFLKSCIGCKNCMFCTNLINQEYCVFNKQVSKEEYNIEKERFLNELKKNKQNLQKDFIEFLGKNIAKYASITNSENCIGDNIMGSKNCKECFISNNSENVAYSFMTDKAINCYDCDSNNNLENSYYSLICGAYAYNCHFCIAGWDNCKNLLYSDYCFFCSNCFGCIGLKNKSYCILNKQYTKEQYEELVSKIIEHMMNTGEWGEFFPSSISPFGYNETVAMEYFPISRDKALPYLYKWSDYEPPFPKVDKIIPANKLPENISDIPDDILNRAIECEITKKPFRIISQELEFYRKHNLPIPKRHPDQRHLDRMNLRNPRKLFDRKCDKCGKNIKTTYSPDRKEIVYCEECYIGEIY